MGILPQRRSFSLFLFFGFFSIRSLKDFVRKVDRICLAGQTFLHSYGEFDPSSERTLAAWIRHASRAGLLAVSEV